MNTIKNLSVNVQAKVKYEIPTEGSFLAIWSYRDMPFSGTYQWRNGELAVMTDLGWEIAGVGAGEDYYTFEALVDIAKGESLGGVVKFIAVVVVEVGA